MASARDFDAIVYAQMTLISAYADVFSQARGPNFGHILN